MEAKIGLLCDLAFVNRPRAEFWAGLSWAGEHLQRQATMVLAGISDRGQARVNTALSSATIKYQEERKCSDKSDR